MQNAKNSLGPLDAKMTDEVSGFFVFKMVLFSHKMCSAMYLKYM